MKAAAEPGDGAPPSYASRDEARAYVARVLARPAPARPGEVYLIMRPGRRPARQLDKLRPTLAVMLPGAELVGHNDVFKGTPVEVPERVERLAARVRGALVIAVQLPAQEAWGIGPSARAEADGLIAAGLPVLVLTPHGLVGWPDVRVRPMPEPQPTWLPWALDLPAPARWRDLPTSAASLRAIGIRPQPRRQRPAPRRVRTAPGRGRA